MRERRNAHERSVFTGERLVPGDALLRPMRVENLARFEFFRQRAAGPRTLDVGCGAGEGTAYLSRQTDWQVIGLDHDGATLKAAASASRDSRAQFFQGDACRLSFAERQFDSIISVEVIEHLSNPQDFLAEVRRVLRPGGLFVLTTPNRLRSSPTPGSLWPAHVREYSPAELESLLRPYFDTVRLWAQYVPVYEAHALRRLVRRLAPMAKPWLPQWLRIRALPGVQWLIKPQLEINDVRFTRDDVAAWSTLVAECRSNASAAG
jgi:2-polyprenyl-3-methyl-5-hydroxy-6-metoxy-1,4-benzoquinol methylase